MPAALRFIETPVILCVWSDTALNECYDAGQVIHDARIRRHNNNYWSLVAPKHDPSKRWLIFNMLRNVDNDRECILKLRNYVTYTYEMVLLHPPPDIIINNNHNDWLHDATDKRGMELLIQYTGSESNASELLRRIGPFQSFFE